MSLLLVPQNALIPMPPFLSLESVLTSMDKQNAPKQVHEAEHEAVGTGPQQQAWHRGLMWRGRSGVSRRGQLGKHRLIGRDGTSAQKGTAGLEPHPLVENVLEAEQQELVQGTWQM